MRCPECVAAGQPSRVYEHPKQIIHGRTVSYWDESDRYHFHDATKMDTPFMCSNGHQWFRLGRNPCPTCKVPVDPEPQ